MQHHPLARNRTAGAGVYTRSGEVRVSLLLSVLALLATFYQLYLQRVHNAKSLKPLGQIVLEDQHKTLAVHLRNQGLGPLLIDRLTFSKDGMACAGLEACLALPPGSYQYTSTHDAVMRVVLPHGSQLVFHTCFDEHEGQVEMDNARQQLAPITLTVEGRDIYDNKIKLSRDLNWFVRHLPNGKPEGRLVNRHTDVKFSDQKT